jgi:hypothetical protein
MQQAFHLPVNHCCADIVIRLSSYSIIFGDMLTYQYRVLREIYRGIMLCTLLLLLNTIPLHAATRENANHMHAWYMYIGDHAFSKRWGVHLEAQFRRVGLLTQPQQLLLRTGINYQLNAHAIFTAGYCFVETYPYGDFPVKSTFPEHRIWQQLQVKQQLGAFEWISRFRLEQRFSNLAVEHPVTQIAEPGDAVYTNRFRLMHRFSIPFRGKIIQDGSWYLSAYDEFFINFGPQVSSNLFDQNRAYLALGYKLKGVGKLEMGYLEQTIIKPNGLQVENNHTFQLGLLSTIDFKRN